MPTRPADPAPPKAATLRFVAAAVASAIAAYAFAHVWNSQRLMHLALWIVIGLIVLPILCTIALAIVASILTGLLAVLCIPSWLTGRPTGIENLLRELWRLPADILPALWRELRTTNRPGQFGAATGFVTGMIVFACWHGLAAT